MARGPSTEEQALDQAKIAAVVVVGRERPRSNVNTAGDISTIVIVRRERPRSDMNAAGDVAAIVIIRRKWPWADADASIRYDTGYQR